MKLKDYLNQVRERADKASEAPWYPNPEPLTNRSDIVNDYKKIGTAIENLDHLFISYSRQDIPRLLNIIEIQREALETIKKSFEVDYYDAKVVLADLEDEHKIVREAISTCEAFLKGMEE